MELYNQPSANSDPQLYRALSIGDLPAARLLCGLSEKSSKTFGKPPETENPAASFNRGLCLFLLEEYEKALSELKRAEQQLGNPPDIDIANRDLFIKAVKTSSLGKDLFLLPLDPECAQNCARYMLIRVKYLSAVCLKKLGREGEAAMIKRFLSQYNIEL